MQAPAISLVIELNCCLTFEQRPKAVLKFASGAMTRRATWAKIAHRTSCPAEVVCTDILGPAPKARGF